MHGFAYYVFWLVLTAMPVLTAWKRQWLAFAVYAAGWLFFLYTVLDKRDSGWDDLADLATLIVVVIPIYLVASIIWLVGIGRGRRKEKR